MTAYNWSTRLTDLPFIETILPSAIITFPTLIKTTRYSLEQTNTAHNLRNKGSAVIIVKGRNIP